MRSAGIFPTAALLLAACAAPGPDGASTAAPSSAGLVQDGPFRMRITGTHANIDPDGKLDVVFETVLETADGRAFPPDRWFFEYPRLVETPLLTGDEEAYQEDDTVAMPSGWSRRGYVLLSQLPAATRLIRRLVIDLPMLEILEGVFEEIRLGEEESESRSIDALNCDFSAGETGLSILRDYSDEDFEDGQLRHHLRLESFYGCDSRPIEHAWEITDALGRPFVEGPTWGVGAVSQALYHPGPLANGVVEYPIVVRWRVPRRWRATMQRFVFEDLVVPAPEPDREPVPPPEDK